MVGGAVGVLAVIGYAAAKRAGVLPGPNTFNPLSPDNLAYRGANEVYRALTGNQVDTIGTALASNYSDQVGREITAPVPIKDGHAVQMAPDAWPYVGDLPLAGDYTVGPGGAVFGLYRP